MYVITIVQHYNIVPSIKQISYYKQATTVFS